MFSVLLSVYVKEKPQYLSLALKSIWNDQTLKPSEIILVKDGPLTAELDLVIQDAKNSMPLKTVSLPQNLGLGIALQKGIYECSNDLIARMDTDDIAIPSRFEQQVDFMENNKDISLLSSNISEFATDPNVSTGIRSVPMTHDAILQFAKRRNPMNHMAVMYRRSAVLASGNYQTFHGYEDYYLWVRMLLKGYKAANLDLVLIKARGGRDLLSRRQGVKFFKEELRLQNEFHKLGLTNRTEYYTNVFLRATPRLFPIFIFKIIYKLLRK